MELAGPGQIPLVMADLCQVVQGGGDVCVALPMQLLEEFEGPLVELARLGKIPLDTADLR